MESKELTLQHNTDNLPAVETIHDMLKKAEILLKSGFLPDAIKKPEQVVVIMEVAKSLDIPAIHALNSIHVIRGKPTMSAELMRALINRAYPDATFEPVERTDKKCVIKAARPGKEPQDFEYTMEMAKRAHLNEKDNWKQYPEDMLFARCTARVARALFPEVCMGTTYLPEELGAEVDKDGNVIKLPPEEEITKAFTDIDVTKEELDVYCQEHFDHPLSEITLEDIAELRTVWNAIVHSKRPKDKYFKPKKKEQPLKVEDIVKPQGKEEPDEPEEEQEEELEPTEEEIAALNVEDKEIEKEEKKKTEATQKEYNSRLIIIQKHRKKFDQGKYMQIIQKAMSYGKNWEKKIAYLEEEIAALGLNLNAELKQLEEKPEES